MSIKNRGRLHKIIMPSGQKEDVDHIDGDRTNNTRKNLRLCSRSQNCFNKHFIKNNTSGYKGVSFDKRHKKWRAYIGFNGKCKKLGYFPDPKSAAILYHGEFACLNIITEEN